MDEVEPDCDGDGDRRHQTPGFGEGLHERGESVKVLNYSTKNSFANWH